MSAKSILHIAKMTNVSGMENHLLELLPGLRRRGVDVRLCILVEPDKPLDEYAVAMRKADVPTQQVIIERDLDFGLIRRLADLLRSEKIVAVHTHLIHADLHGSLAARRAGIQHVISSAHNDDKFRNLLPVRLLQGWLWRRMDAGIAISEALRQFLIKVEFAPPQRIYTVHYGFDPAKMPENSSLLRTNLRQELGLSNETPVIGSVCRLVEQKGLRYALDSFAQVLRTLPDAHYVIVGDGPLREVLQAQAKALNIEKNIHFLGWRTDARSLFNAFDALLMPSLWEGFGLVALEAMATCLPLIVSRVGALPEIVVDGQTGIIVPPADTSALAGAIKTLLGDLRHARLLGENGRHRLETEFSVDRMVESTLTVYQQVLA